MNIIVRFIQIFTRVIIILCMATTVPIVWIIAFAFYGASEANDIIKELFFGMFNE